MADETPAGLVQAWIKTAGVLPGQPGQAMLACAADLQRVLDAAAVREFDRFQLEQRVTAPDGSDPRWEGALGYDERASEAQAWRDYDTYVRDWQGQPQDHKDRYGHDAREFLRVIRIHRTIETSTEVITRGPGH
jgi:hypothetical protein